MYIYIYKTAASFIVFNFNASSSSAVPERLTSAIKPVANKYTHISTYGRTSVRGQRHRFRRGEWIMGCC